MLIAYTDNKVCLYFSNSLGEKLHLESLHFFWLMVTCRYYSPQLYGLSVYMLHVLGEKWRFRTTVMPRDQICRFIADFTCSLDSSLIFYDFLNSWSASSLIGVHINTASLKLLHFMAHVHEKYELYARIGVQSY